MAFGAVGLITTATSASALPVTETFAAHGPTGPLELQVSETINQPATVTLGNNITISVPGSSQLVPTAQSGVPVNFISGLTTIIPVPANSTYVGNIVGGNWTYTPASGPAVTGALSVVECTAPVAGSCTATTPDGSTFLGPGTSTPYLEATTGTATFPAGGTLALPGWSFDVTASSPGSIVSTVSEFDTNANVNLGTVLHPSNVDVAVTAYPAVVEAGCFATPTACTTQPAYQFQPIASTTIVSPPAPPILQGQIGNVSAGQCTNINALTGATEVSDTPNPASVTVVAGSGPAHGTATANPDGTVHYCNTGGSAPTDSFMVTAAGTANPSLVSTAVTETINISYNQCSAGAGTAAGATASLGQCSLHQAIILPVTSGQIILSQASGLPVDPLGSSFCGATPTVPGITLNGNVQAACGAVSPLTITNATGLDAGWTLTGQVTDFHDPADPSLTCDTVLTYSNHCIPGGNLAWGPAAAVAHAIVPGDTALVTAGSPVAPPATGSPAASLNPVLQGAPVQANPVLEPATTAGLHDAPATMCSTVAGQSGGTFVCGAGLELLVPASAAEPIVGPFGMPAYQATLTVTLS